MVSVLTENNRPVGRDTRGTPIIVIKKCIRQGNGCSYPKGCGRMAQQCHGDTYASSGDLGVLISKLVCTELFWAHESFFHGNWKTFYQGSFEKNSRQVLKRHCRMIAVMLNTTVVVSKPNFLSDRGGGRVFKASILYGKYLNVKDKEHYTFYFL